MTKACVEGVRAWWAWPKADSLQLHGLAAIAVVQMLSRASATLGLPKKSQRKSCSAASYAVVSTAGSVTSAWCCHITGSACKAALLAHMPRAWSCAQPHLVGQLNISEALVCGAVHPTHLHSQRSCLKLDLRLQESVHFWARKSGLGKVGKGQCQQRIEPAWTRH